MANMSLIGEKVYLNPTHENDIPFLANFMNDDHIKYFGRNCGSAIYETKMKTHFEENKEDERYTIFRKDNNEIIGDISINSIDIYNRAGSLSVIIYGKENRGKGFGKEAILLILKHAFIDLNLENIDLGTWEYNKAAIHVYEKIGFKLIGRRRNRRIVGNSFYDEIIMDMISDEYFKLYGNTELEKYKTKTEL
ncbi:GCN5-related N-acetyltransferase [Sediminispirochaeta smaragdinae DSM 11293]|uniref:GCN5-related N-acetyltransferase n=2 Tax=Sediminispirochaeta TaxID=1911556 RepID=E1RB36_SEDSS|nr:GCN5-related N-acetyltransferase [Sediminispirochaeta smaragdinae DSM 11293]